MRDDAVDGVAADCAVEEEAEAPLPPSKNERNTPGAASITVSTPPRSWDSFIGAAMASLTRRDRNC